MRSTEDLIAAVHRRVAQVAIGPSALRNQGAPGVVEAARRYFEEQVELRSFRRALATDIAYQSWLNKHTAALMQAFPRGARHWGAARKALNLFCRDVCCNTLLAGEVGLPSSPKAFNQSVRWLEVPLDKDVALGIREQDPSLPRWPGIRHVKPSESVAYQQAALAYAKRLGTARINLDLVLWRAAK